MGNPLDQVVSVEDRPDGVYIKVSRLEKASLSVNNLLKVLDNAGVINYDLAKIADVIQRTRGVFERIGPTFEFYNKVIEDHIEVSITAIKASAKLNSTCIASGIRPSEKTFTYALNKKGIRFGVKPDVVRKIITEVVYDTMVEVAEAKPPVIGADAKVYMEIQLSPDSKPTMKSDGTVDYRDIHTFTSVSQGQVLAKKVPATKGIDGTAVNGETIISEPGKDVLLPLGKNTELIDNGNTLIASKSGIVYIQNDLLMVVELLNIPKNVDYSVGNVKYNGDIFINGNVLPGFSVEAEGNIHITGDVESARVLSRNGRVRIDRGVIGKGDTLVSAKIGINLNFAQEAQVITDGDLVVSKFLMHCNCRCMSLEMKEGQSSLIGGTISAEQTITVFQVGSEKGVKTKLELVDKKKLVTIEKIKELGLLETKLICDIAPVEKQLKTKAAIMKRSGEEITDRHREELKKWAEAYNQINLKIKYVKQKIVELTEMVKKPKDYDGYIKIGGSLHPGTEIILYEIICPINTIMTNKCFKLKNSIVESEEQP